jgi:hypothetical protein
LLNNPQTRNLVFNLKLKWHSLVIYSVMVARRLLEEKLQYFFGFNTSSLAIMYGTKYNQTIKICASAFNN